MKIFTGIVVALFFNFFFFCILGRFKSWRESGLRWNVPGEILREAVYMYNHPTTHNIINGTRWSRDLHYEFPTMSVEKKIDIQYIMPDLYESADHFTETHICRSF